MLHAATCLKDLKPFFRFHEYGGADKGTYSWDVSGNQRLLYRFEEGDVFSLDYTDPH